MIRGRAAVTVRGVRVGLVVGIWIAVVVAWIAYRRSTGLGTTAAVQELVDAASGAWWAVFAFVVVSVLRPFVFLPATLLTMAAGLVFGPVAGVAVAAAGANLSALVGHTVGGAFVGEVERDGRLARWRGRMATNGFESILLMRLLFLPYDLVNYAAGYLRVRRVPFLSATAIGSFPATVSFVLLGASLTNLADGTGGIDRRAVVASVALILASLVASRVVRARTATMVPP